MKNKEAICEMLEELERDILKKGSMDERDLKNLYRISAIVTDYETREAMKMGGYSQHYPPNMWMDRINSYENSMGMSREGNSTRRGRDMRTGRYVSRDSGSYDGSYGNSYDGSYDGSYGEYSREEVADQFKGKLRKLMDEAPTEEAKNTIRQAINSIR
ncbi:hypothetical protein [Ruminococcus sp.]|uniref:hypothetical protein n=1 Tax=Ruminococcus sp. TaxID=41978 RepID=UPI003890FD95